MRERTTGCRGLTVFRLLALALAAATLPAGSCDDNLGSNEPGPATFRASVGRDNLQANFPSEAPSISADGRFVAFASTANNLTLQPSTFKEIFVRDRQNDVVHNISRLVDLPSAVTPEDCENPFISANGRFVVFETTAALDGSAPPATPTKNLFVRDRLSDLLLRVVYGTASAWPDGNCTNATISADGTWVAFETTSTNLGFANASATIQVYVATFDWSMTPPSAPPQPTLTLVSHAIGAPSVICNTSAFDPMVSPDGSSVVFVSTATDLNADSPLPALQEIFLWSSTGGLVELVSRVSGATGARADDKCFKPAISADGRFVAFISKANNLVPGVTNTSIFLRDRNTPFSTTQAVDDVFFVEISFPPFFFFTFDDRLGISDDGRFIAYSSNDGQVHVKDAQGGTIVASVNQSGGLSNTASSFNFSHVAISGDGKWVVWESDADNLVFGDTNGVTDIFGRGSLR